MLCSKQCCLWDAPSTEASTKFYRALTCICWLAVWVAVKRISPCLLKMEFFNFLNVVLCQVKLLVILVIVCVANLGGVTVGTQPRDLYEPQSDPWWRLSRYRKIRRDRRSVFRRTSVCTVPSFIDTSKKRKKKRRWRHLLRHLSVENRKHELFEMQAMCSSLSSEIRNNYWHWEQQGSVEGFSTIIKWIEWSVALFVLIPKQKTVGDLIHLLNLSMGAFAQKSIVSGFIDLAEPLIEEQRLSKEFQQQSLKEIFGRYKKFKKSSYLNHLRKFICCFLATVLTKEHREVVEPYLAKVDWELKPIGSLKFAEYVVETVVKTLEVVDLCLKEKSVGPLLVSECNLEELEAESVRLLSNKEMAMAGRWVDIEFKCEAAYIDAIVDHQNAYARAISICKDKRLQLILSGKKREMHLLEQDFVATLNDGRLRVAPFAVAIHGETGVGKTAAANLIMKRILASGGFSDKPENICTLKETDKFDSTLNAATSGVYFDDVANTASNFNQISPLFRLITIVNNIPDNALSPIAEMKGKIPYRVKAVVATTNVQHLDAAVYSNAPLSILRRLKFFIRARVAPDYCLPGSTMLDSTKDTSLQNMTNVWKFDVQQATAGPMRSSGQPQAIFVPVNREDGTPLMDLNINELLAFLDVEARKHFSAQEGFIASMRDLESLKACPHGSFEKVCASCPFVLQSLMEDTGDGVEESKDPEPELLAESTFVAQEASPPPSQNRNVFVAKPSVPVFGYYTAKLFWYLTSLLPWNTALAMMEPQPILYGAKVSAGIVASMVLPAYFGLPMLLLCSVSTLHLYACTCAHRFIGNLSPTQWLSRNCKVLILGGITLVTLILVFKRWSRVYMFQQGAEEKIPVASEGERVNVWKRSDPVIRERPQNLAPVTTTCPDLADYLGRRVVKAQFLTGDGRRSWSNIVPLKGNLWLCNTHVWDQMQSDELTILAQFGQSGRALAVKRARVHRMETKEFRPNSDLTVMSIPQFGDQADITKYFPPLQHKGIKFPNVLGKFVDKTKNAECSFRQLYDFSHQHIDIKDGPKGVAVLGYSAEEDFAYGMCGAPIVARAGSATLIQGFHRAGNGSRGAATVVYKEAWDDFEKRFYSSKPCVKVMSSGEMEFEQYGRTIYKGETPHYRNAVSFLQEESNVDCFGTAGGERRTIRSAIIASPISEEVTQVFGEPRKHGPPSGMKNPTGVVKAKWEALGDQAVIHEKECLYKAVKSVRKKIFNFLNANPHLREQLHVYPVTVAVSGADGVYGVDAMPKQTSSGYPLNRSKIIDLVRIDEEVEGISEPFTVSPEVNEEMEKMKAAYLQGKRSYAWFRGNMKDEPTRMDKQKVRVFMGAPLAFNVLFRQYYLSILRLMQLYNREFECAVGVNNFSKDWQKLHNILTRDGELSEQRVIAGDHKQYDDKQSADMTSQSMETMIMIAKWANFTENQLTIMRGLMTDAIYPVFELDGVLGRACGTVPSGFNATVQLNNLDNSTYMRMAFFQLAPPDFEDDFDEHVSLLCYGDDNIACVSEEVAPWYNHTSVAAALAKHGVVYTMADKTAESVPFINLSDATFLKRRWVYRPETQDYACPIEMASIFKMLHTARADSHLEQEETICECVHNAMREAFQHGRDVYNDFSDKLMLILRMKGMELLYPEGFATYDELVDAHNVQYGQTDCPAPDVSGEDVKNTPFTNGAEE